MPRRNRIYQIPARTSSAASAAAPEDPITKQALALFATPEGAPHRDPNGGTPAWLQQNWCNLSPGAADVLAVGNEDVSLDRLLEFWDRYRECYVVWESITSSWNLGHHWLVKEKNVAVARNLFLNAGFLHFGYRTSLKYAIDTLKLALLRGREGLENPDDGHSRAFYRTVVQGIPSLEAAYQLRLCPRNLFSHIGDIMRATARAKEGEPADHWLSDGWEEVDERFAAEEESSDSESEEGELCDADKDEEGILDGDSEKDEEDILVAFLDGGRRRAAKMKMVDRHCPLKRLFADYAEVRGASLRNLRFSYRNQRIFLSAGNGNQTPDELGMKYLAFIVVSDASNDENTKKKPSTRKVAPLDAISLNSSSNKLRNGKKGGKRKKALSAKKCC